jgi:hypothetical protein
MFRKTNNSIVRQALDTRRSTGRTKEKGQTLQQLEKKRNEGTRGNLLELDGHKNDSEDWKDTVTKICKGSRDRRCVGLYLRQPTDIVIKKGMWPSCVERYTPKPVSQ